jgi:hypothetical protein
VRPVILLVQHYDAIDPTHATHFGVQHGIAGSSTYVFLRHDVRNRGSGCGKAFGGDDSEIGFGDYWPKMLVMTARGTMERYRWEIQSNRCDGCFV